MILIELLRWLQDKKVTLQHLFTKAWKEYYAPIAAEDVAVAICDLRVRLPVWLEAIP
jgi:hypothetical protein